MDLWLDGSAAKEGKLSVLKITSLWLKLNCESFLDFYEIPFLGRSGLSWLNL